jgi:hypothetical protein
MECIFCLEDGSETEMVPDALKIQDDDSALDKTMNNVHKRNICTNVPSSQTFRSYFSYSYFAL